VLICQAPLRISFFGGGSDLPAFLKNNEGQVLSTAINRRIYIIGHESSYVSGIQFRYSQIEVVDHPELLQHPIARVVLSRYGLNNLEVAVLSDIPAGTGLGSSSAFTVALLAFARTISGQRFTSADLASEACEIEIGTLNEPIGFQDQWISAIGGIQKMTFRGKSVATEAIHLSSHDLQLLEASIFLVPVGKPRRASDFLSSQSAAIEPGSRAERDTRRLAALVERGVEAIQRDHKQLGPLLDQAWRVKREIVDGVSNATIDVVYESGLAVGATGGKLLGAGGGGFFMFVVPEMSRDRFRSHFPDAFSVSLAAEGAGVVNAN